MRVELPIIAVLLCADLLLRLPFVAAGGIGDVQSIVIFMQENRAFDHYYGTLGGVRVCGALSHDS